MQYSQLREKIQNPIRAARSIVIHQSLSDRFITAFTEQVQRNGVYRIPPGSPVHNSTTVPILILSIGILKLTIYSLWSLALDVYKHCLKWSFRKCVQIPMYVNSNYNYKWSVHTLFSCRREDVVSVFVVHSGVCLVWVSGMQPDRTRPTQSDGWPPQPLAQCAGLCSVCSTYSNWKNQLLKIDSSML